MLPKMTHPIFETILPISQKHVKFRPLLVKEEKLLLLSKETKELDSIVNCMRQIIENTVIGEINVNELSIIDIQWMFIQLRIRSIGGSVRCTVTDPTDKKNYDVEIDLNNIKIKPENFSRHIMLNDNLGLNMKLPGLKDVHDVTKYSNSLSTLSYNLILNCIESVFDGDSVYPTFTNEELTEFVDSLSGEQIEKLVDFFDNLPKIVLQYSYTTEDGKVREWEVDKFRDFFI